MAPRVQNPVCDKCQEPLPDGIDPHYWVMPRARHKYLLPMYFCYECCFNPVENHHGRVFMTEAEADLALITEYLCPT